MPLSANPMITTMQRSAFSPDHRTIAPRLQLLPASMRSFSQLNAEADGAVSSDQPRIRHHRGIARGTDGRPREFRHDFCSHGSTANFVLVMSCANVSSLVTGQSYGTGAGDCRSRGAGRNALETGSSAPCGKSGDRLARGRRRYCCGMAGGSRVYRRGARDNAPSICARHRHARSDFQRHNGIVLRHSCGGAAAALRLTKADVEPVSVLRGEGSPETAAGCRELWSSLRWQVL